MMEELMGCGRVGVVASEELGEPVALGASVPKPRFAVVHDPLDGSSNIDAGIPTGTIFGVYPVARGAGGEVDGERRRDRGPTAAH
jgi:fructose-1,6-bisphosphatase I